MQLFSCGGLFDWWLVSVGVFEVIGLGISARVYVFFFRVVVWVVRLCRRISCLVVANLVFAA